MVASHFPVGKELSIVVLDPEGSPVEGAMIVAGDTCSFRAFGVRRTDALGRVRMENLPVAPVEVRVLEISPERSRPAGLLLAPQSATVAPEEKEITLQFQDAVAVEGLVLGPGGEPLSGATVLARTGGRRPAHFCVSQEEGRFSIPIPRGADYRLEARYAATDGRVFRSSADGIAGQGGAVVIQMVP